MAINVRLAEGLHEEARAYADGLGISLNSLLAVALRDYLDGRRKPVDDLVPAAAGEPEASTGRRRTAGHAEGRGPEGVPSTAVVEPAEGSAPVDDGKGEPDAFKRAMLWMRGGKRQPCGCGSGKPWRNCHGKGF